MMVPSPRALLLLGLLLLVGLASVVDRRLMLVMFAADALVVALVWIDGRALRSCVPRVILGWQKQLRVGKPALLKVELENLSNRSQDVGVRMAWPVEQRAEAREDRVLIPAGQSVVLEWGFTPVVRGEMLPRPIEIEVRSPLGLAIHRSQRDAGDAKTLVYPSLNEISAYERLYRSRSLGLMGVHQQRMLGLGDEFDHIRDYVSGDDYRNLNWKATARTGRPKTNLFRTERGRDVVLCVDGGRTMGLPSGEGSALDRAVDAAVLVSHAALREGDRVGLVTYRDRVVDVHPPSNTPVARQRMVATLAGFRSEPVYPSLMLLVEAIRLRQSHRALLILFTDLRDTQVASDLAEVLPLLSARHEVMVVVLRDPRLEEIADGPADDAEDVTAVLAARALLLERERHTRAMRHTGIQLVESTADRLALDAVNRYLEAKSRQMF